MSFVILITQWKGEKKMHCIFSKWNKCVFIFHEGHWRECHTNIRVLLLIRTFPRLNFLSKCVVQYRVWVHVGWKCSRMLAILTPCDPICFIWYRFICHTFSSSTYLKANGWLVYEFYCFLFFIFIFLKDMF